jgi:hypothetical protein
MGFEFLYDPFVFFHAGKISSNTRRFHQLDLHYAPQKIAFLLQGDTEYPDAVNK